LQAAHEALLANAAAKANGNSVASQSVRPDAPNDDAHPAIRRPPLTADHEAILAVLAKSPEKCKTVIDVAGAGPIRNRETVGRLLTELAGFGLVDRPHGIRKGYALTHDGLKRLNSPNAVT